MIAAEAAERRPAAFARGGSSLAGGVLLACGLGLTSGCAAPVRDGPTSSTTRPATGLTTAAPSAIELRYLRQTAATIYRGRPLERSAAFLPSAGDGYRLCVRAAVKGGYDHTLFTLQRRIAEDFIPQAGDDVLIERTSAATMPCRDPRIDWISLR